MNNSTFITIVMTTALFAGCNDAKRPTTPAQQVKTMVTTKADRTLNQQYSARLTGRQIVEVRPQVSGCITSININEGQQVRQGQTLFIIDQVPYKAALQVATANVRSAEARLATAIMNQESEQRLNEGNVTSDFALRTARNARLEAEAALAQAKAQEQNARNNLSYTVVKSPVSGSASMIPWHVGSLVSSSITEPLVTVADDSEIYAYFSVTEQQALALIQQYGSLEAFTRQAPAVELLLADGTHYDIKGCIDAVSGTIDGQTGAVSLRATFKNPRHLLHNGGAATVIVPTTRRQVVVVPQEATYELQNRVFVYRVVNGRTKAAPIKVFGLNDGREYIVEQGLNPGDTIVAEGAGLLREGIEVR